ncbi:MAG: MFS transporter [Salinisphaera sp.]|nr:MFS transporter [Salinisphaera sp.]
MAPSDNVLRIPAFRHLVGGRLAAASATQIQSVVVAWQLYALTRDPMTLAWVGLAQFVPMFLLVLPAGDLADRIDRRYLLAASYGTQGLAAALFVLLTWRAPHALPGFYAVLVLFGMARAFAGPATQSLLPQLVGRRLLSRGIAWNSSFLQMAIIGGPALGGLLYLFGPMVAYAVCFALFVAGAGSVFTIGGDLPRAAQGHNLGPWARFTAGLAYVRGRPAIAGALSMDLFAVLLGGITALLPIYAYEILHVGPVGLGLLRSAIAVGAFAMGLYLGQRPLQRHAGPKLFASVALFGLAILMFALSHDFYLSMAALGVAGAADMISMFVRNSLVQLTTTDAMRGRVSAVNSLCIGASNELGEFESGVAAAWFGAVPAALIGGAGTLAVVALWWAGFPSLRRVDRLNELMPDA